MAIGTKYLNAVETLKNNERLILTPGRRFKVNNSDEIYTAEYCANAMTSHNSKGEYLAFPWNMITEVLPYDA